MSPPNIERLLPLNILHQFETAATRLNLVDRARRDFIDQLAQDDAVAEQVLVRLIGQFLADDSFNPFDNLLLLFFASTLQNCFYYPVSMLCCVCRFKIG